MGEQQTYDQVFKRVKLQKVQEKNAEAYEAEQKASQQEIDNYLQICRVHDPLVMLNDVKFMERNNSIADKFHILTREDSVSASQLKPDAREQAEIDKLQAYPDFIELS